MEKETKEIRQALADYMQSEGCGCCENTEEHTKSKAQLAKLLKVPKYSDGYGYGYGYDFNQFASKPDETDKCYLMYDEDGYLVCSYNHTLGAECLLNKEE